MTDIIGDITNLDVGGAIEAIELETRDRVWIRECKIAGCLALKPEGPTRLLFVGGGHIDVCGNAHAWAIRIRIAELTDKRGES